MLSKPSPLTLSILAVHYSEPSYRDTVKCIEATGLPVTYVFRNPEGVGSLAEAINRGMKEMTTDYVWIVTNITFTKLTPLALLSDVGEAAIISPAFKSDHKFMNEKTGVYAVPFVEFTAPLVRRDSWLPLNEEMPYWGHDLDHGYRAWQKGLQVLVSHNASVEHIYIRKAKLNPITAKRLRLRRSTDESTRQALAKIYGENWRQETWIKSERSIGTFIQQIMKQQALSLTKIIVIDADGVLTDGKVWYSATGERSKAFHSRDIRAIRELVANGYEVIINTQSDWQGLHSFAERTGALVLVGKEKHIPDQRFIMIGDDTPDIELMKAAAAAYCPADADKEVQKHCIKLKANGGEGVIAEFTRLLIHEESN